MSPTAAPGPRAAPARGLLALLALASLLPDLGAALPTRSYYFRDFSVTFYPLRLFAARELAARRWPVWNPYIHEGSFALPNLYPVDLLHVFTPGPVFVSWLLTLHLPLAALCAYALARDLGMGRAGAFITGAVYALGGLSLSSLNLYVFLQALALAPLIALTFRRAAGGGGRWIAAASLALAVGLSTVALEFVVQGLALGLALGIADRPRRWAAARLGAGVLLGVGLAGVTVFTTLGLLSETVRGAGFPTEVALGNAAHPVSLLQALVPTLFGRLDAPAEVWWGGHFFSKGLPYFMSLYLGPLALALAWTGTRYLDRRRRWVLLGGGGFALWYALGARGGLATVLHGLPFLQWFRFPSKALLLPHLVVALLAGAGAERLRRGAGWPRFRHAAGTLAALTAGLGAAVAAAPRAVGSWTHVDPAWIPAAAAAVSHDALRVALVALLGAAVALAVTRGWLNATPAVATLAAVLVLDLARAGAGMNPQVEPSFFELLPELDAQHLNDLEGGRVFSYGLDESPAFRRFLGSGDPRLGLASFYVNRQLLGPYNNVLDRVETPEAKDLTSFVPRPRELGPEDYDPRAVGALIPWLRNAAVSRVLSLDPLDHPELRLLAVVPVRRPALSIHVYGLAHPWPRGYVACRVLPARTVGEALGRPLAPDFKPARDVALEEPGSTSCHTGSVRRLRGEPGLEEYEVEADGAGYFVSRESFGRGWTARVDGGTAGVLRANGKHQAVPVPAGRHRVELRYRAPGLRAGIWSAAFSAAALVLLACAVRAGEGSG